MPAPTEASAIDATPEAGGAMSAEGSPVDEARAMDPDSGAVDAGPDAPPDDVGPPEGLRCGGGDLGDASYCPEPGATCCMRTEEAGVSYACSTASACPHNSSDTLYPIGCAGAEDCGRNAVCCHYGSHTACTLEFDAGAAAAASACTRLSGSVVCDRGSPANQCPTGSCSAPLDPDHVYWACSM
jgi:hypothetical protein